MALIKCPECGKEVSDKAKSCIHCGYPLGECKNEAIEETRKGDDISEDAPYACKINGVIWNMKWVLDALEAYSEEELNMIKIVARYMMNPDPDVRMSYKFKNQKEKGLFYELSGIAKKIMNHVNLERIEANRFIYEILENDKMIPKEFNGKTFTEWSEEQKKIVQSWVHCKYCNSAAVRQLGPFEKLARQNLGKEWHCNKCGSNF